MGMRPPAVTVTLLEDPVSEKIQRPYLTSVGMAAYLYVDSKGVSLRETVRLMIQNHDRASCVCFYHELRQRQPSAVAPVVASDQLQAAREFDDTVPQYLYIPLDKIADATVNSADIFMITRNHIHPHRGLKRLKRIIERRSQNRLQVIVYQVTGYYNQIGMM